MFKKLVKTIAVGVRSDPTAFRKKILTTVTLLDCCDTAQLLSGGFKSQCWHDELKVAISIVPSGLLKIIAPKV